MITGFWSEAFIVIRARAEPVAASWVTVPRYWDRRALIWVSLTPCPFISVPLSLQMRPKKGRPSTSLSAGTYFRAYWTDCS